MILSNAAITGYFIRGAQRGDGVWKHTAATLPHGVPLLCVASTPGSKTMARLAAAEVSADREIMVRSAVFERMAIFPKAGDRVTLRDLASNPAEDVTVEVVEVRRSELPARRRGSIAVFTLVAKRTTSTGAA
ncbi:MAG: hypothetical protein IBJ10_10040 [Phycisphaerales bacterium]|nr:hypothetical protein [Phycisphaerales bacterium]